MLSVAKHLIPSSLPNRLHRLCHPLSPTTDRGPAHPPRNLPEIWTAVPSNFDHTYRLLIDGKPL